MSNIKIPAEVLLQDEMLCLRILRKIANPTILCTLNMNKETYDFTFVKAMGLLIKYGLIDMSNDGNVTRTDAGKEVIDNIVEFLKD